ncbi:MAG: hypothetical protein AAB670_00065 [Patescibacteria group bacterium]
MHKNLESGAGDLSKFSQGEEVELKLEDIEDLVPPEENHGEIESLTPEKIKQIWEGLSDTEKRFVVSKDTVFNSVIDKYEESVGKQRTTLLRALRKLILSHDSRAALIETEFNR